MTSNIFRRHLYTCLFLLLHAASTAGYADSSKSITLLADEWMPYNGKPGAKLPGYMIEIAEYAFGKQGYQVDYQLEPWERSMELVSKGEKDCVVGAFRNDSRNFVFHKESYGKTDIAFYGHIDARAWRYQGVKSLEGYTLAVIGGYSYGPHIDAYIAHPNHDVHIAKGDDALERNIQMLLSRRVDILAESHTVFSYISRNMPAAVNIKELDRRGSPEDVYIACSPKNPQSQAYARMLDEGIIELRQRGELKKILAKYGLEDWQ